MKYLNSLLVLVSMLLPTTVWAQGAGQFGPTFPALTNPSYINLYYHELDEILYLTQESSGCTVGSPGMYLVGVSTVVCAESEEITGSNTAATLVKKFLGDHWKKENIDPSERQSSIVKLASGIDFKGTMKTNIAGEYYCDGVDFGTAVGGLEFSGEVFDGTGKTISNVCGVSYAGAWKTPMGLFKKIPQGSTVKDLKLDNVNFIILNKADNSDVMTKTVPTTESSYSPVGAIAGSILGSQVDKISLGYINVSAPLAGGLAGYANNSKITDIQMMESSNVGSKIIVTNDIVLKENAQNSKMGTYKTVLGGLVGASYYNSFKDISIYPETIQCDAFVDSSALGGIAGLFVYAPENDTSSAKIENITLASPTDGENVHIEGGTTMGGLVGETIRESASAPLLIKDAVVKKLLMKESKVSLGNGVANGKTRGIYMGGLVGNGGLCYGGVLKITNSRSQDFTISENVPSNGAYQYFIGGIAGYAGCDGLDNANGDKNDLFLTLANNYASGNIVLSGGHQNTTPANMKYHITASIGGLVGAAMFASEKAVLEDTAAVSISYDAQSTPAGNDAKLDSIAVGGAFGAVNVFKTGVTLEMRKLVVTEYADNDIISVDDNGINSYVGGVVGKFPRINLSGNPSILFNDISVSNSSGKIVAYGGSGNTNAASNAFIGGVCGKCYAVQNLYRIAVKGRIFRKTDADGVLAKKQFYLGGLVGSTQPVGPLHVGNTYSYGDISDFDDNDADGSSAVMGYLIGRLEYPTSASEFVSNYHIGEDFVPAIGDFNGKKNIVDFSTVDSYLLGIANVNVRDGSGKLLTDASQKIYNSGVMDINKMRASEGLVSLLNNAWGDSRTADMIWTLGGTALKYPVFITAPKKQVAVAFVINGEVVSNSLVEVGKAATAPDDDKIPQKDDAGKCFTGWDQDFSNVTEEMTVTAVYADCPVKKYLVTFKDLNGKALKNPVAEDGTSLKNPQEVEEGKSAILPKGPARTGNLCFLKWDDEDANNDYTNVTHNIFVTAISKDCYEVTFYDMDGVRLKNAKTKDGKNLDNPQVVDRGKAAIAPKDPEPTADGKCFSDWAEDFSNVTDNLTVNAKWKTCEYTVKFTYFKVDGSGEKITQSVKHNESATPPADIPQKTNNGRCFTEWDPTVDFTHVKDNLTVTAQYEICKYTVKFMYTDNHGVSQILKTETVEHGSSAIAPKDDEFPQKIDDLCFAGWKPDFSHVTTPLNVTAQYKACGTISSSSTDQSSSSQQPSGSSSSITTSSSSSDQKSSSSGTLTPNSSSSVSYIATITKPSATQQDNALRMTFNDLQADKHTKVDYHIVVESKTGIYLDTVVSGKDIESIKNGTWRLSPAPAGEYTVIVVLTDGRDSVRYDDFLFEGEDEYQVDLLPNTWQTYSLNAFCQNSGGDCKNNLKERFARKAEFGDIEECRHMREELAQNPDDEYFREYVEEICRAAMESQDDATTTAFWWDESNPVGDYWQYRKFNVDQDFDSTRGYWYGSIVKEPLTLSLQTPNMKDEVVWKLENKYSGWNLVANPYGWYVKLPQEDGVTFAKWYPEVSGYDTISVLGPYEAVWVKTERSRVLRIPLKAAIVFEDEWAPPPLLKSATSESWNFRVVLTDNNGKRDAWNELAVGEASSLSEPPAGMGDHVNLSIVEGKQRLAKSVKKNGDDLEWNLEVSATTTRDGKLNFVGLESVWAKGLHVYATIGDETVEVVKDRPVNVKLSSKAKNVSVRVTKSAVAAQVAKNQISGFRVNQMQNALNIGFDAASKLAGAKVKVSIVGVDGRVVATSKSVANEGSNVVSMKKPKQGLYFVRLKVGSQSAVTRIMVR